LEGIISYIEEALALSDAYEIKELYWYDEKN
jgi:hypothetical protein